MICFALLLAFGALFLSDPEAPHIKAAEVSYEQGKQAENEKQFEVAADCFRKAIEVEPTFLEAREALIATYLDSGQELNGAAAMTEFLEIEPGAVKYRILLGQILLKEKQPEKALAQFSLVLERDPHNADGLLGFAAAASEAGIKERASAAMERGRKLYPADKRFKNVSVEPAK